MASKRSQEINPSQTLEGAIPFQLSRVSYLVKKKILEKINHPNFKNITGEELAILGRLYEQPGRSQSELSALTIKDKTTVSRFIARMLKKGFISKEKNASNPRAFQLYLTQKGKAIILLVFKEMDDFSVHLKNSVSKSDLEVTQRTLQKISEASMKWSP